MLSDVRMLVPKWSRL